MRITSGEHARGMEGESRLPDPAGSRQRQVAKIIAREETDDFAQLSVSAHECRRRNRKVRLVERLKRWEVPAAELEDALVRGEVLEAVLAEVGQRGLDRLAVEADTSICPP